MILRFDNFLFFVYDAMHFVGDFRSTVKVVANGCFHLRGASFFASTFHRGVVFLSYSFVLVGLFELVYTISSFMVSLYPSFYKFVALPSS